MPPNALRSHFLYFTSDYAVHLALNESRLFLRGGLFASIIIFENNNRWHFIYVKKIIVVYNFIIIK